MGYASIEKKREYAREWMADRRREYFKDKKCAICGSVEDLQLDHINPEMKENHNIWSWSKKRRDEELKKCQVLCKKCHLLKTKIDLHNINKNKPRMDIRRLIPKQIMEIKKLRKDGYTVRKLAEIYKIGHPSIIKILQGKTYANIK